MGGETSMKSSILQTSVTYLANQNGKDKLFRTIQYFCRLVAYHRGGGELSSRLTLLEKNMSLTRKAMRWGKIPEILQTLSVAFSRESGFALGLSVVRTALLVLYLAFDHMNYLGQVKLVHVDPKYWSQLSAWWWLWSLLASLLSDSLKLKDLAARRSALLMDFSVEPAEKTVRLSRLSAERQRLFLNTVKNILDIPIALSVAYQYKSIHNGHVGLLGTLSSLLGAYQVWEKC